MQMHPHTQPPAPQAWRWPARSATTVAQVKPAQPTSAQDAWTALSAVLSAQRPIAYSVNLARVTGDIKAALFLSQLLYWTRVGVHVESHDGWIFKTREQWTLETGLSRFEQQSVRGKLCTIGLMEQARIGSPARNCYRVVPQALGLALARLLKSEPVQWTLFDIRSNAQQLKALLGRNLAFYRAFSDITTSMTAAVFLTKALSVQRNVAKVQSGRKATGSSPSLLPEHLVPWESEWFHLSSQQWIDETGLTSSQQKDGKQKLCQHELLEEAFQTHPKRRTYLRVNVNKLTQAIGLHLQAKVNAGGAATGLMGVLLRGMGQQSKREGLDTLSNCMAVIQFDKTANITVKPSAKSNSAANLLQSENLPICFALSANPVGEFSPVSLSVLASPMVSFGGLQGSVSADPHAGAVLITNLTTTTTTSGLVKKGFGRKTQTEDNSNPVVVVSENLTAKPERQPEFQNPNQSRIAIQSQTANASPIVWSRLLTDAQTQACSRLLSMGSLPNPERRQALADELAGNLKSGRVKNPIAYLRSLVETDRSQGWNMLLEHADDVAAIRKGQDAQAAHALRAASAAQAVKAELDAGAVAGVVAAQAGHGSALPSSSTLVASDIAKAHLAKIRALRDAVASDIGTSRRGAGVAVGSGSGTSAGAGAGAGVASTVPSLPAMPAVHSLDVPDASAQSNSNRFTASPSLKDAATDGVSGGRVLGVRRFPSRGNSAASCLSNPQ